MTADVADPAAVAPTVPTWAALADLTRGCVACPDLVASRTQVVPGELPTARGGPRPVLLVGEAPGAEEDRTGRPFVGRAGTLLDRELAAAGLPRARVAVANVLKCRPPGNRPPRRAEAAACRPWLDRQVQLADPSVVVALGGTAVAALLGPGARVTDVRGRVHDWRGRRLVATYHPSAAVRFGPRGEPLAALRADLALVASLVAPR